MTQIEHLSLPDALNFEGLERRANYRIIAFREDVLVAFERKDAAAIIFNIVYRWEEVKRDEVLKELDQRRRQGLPPLTEKEIEERLWVYMSYNDFARESGGSVSYNTVIAMIAYLVNNKKVLLQRENHDPRFSDYEYRINKEAMRELLKALPVKPPTYTRIGTTKKKEKTYTKVGTPPTKNGTTYTNSGTATTENGIEVYQSWCTSHITHSNPQDTHSNHTEESGDDATASHQPHALVSHPEYDFIRFNDLMMPTLMVVTLLSEDAGTDEDKQRIYLASWKVMPVLLEKGLKVDLRYEYENEEPPHVDSHDEETLQDDDRPLDTTTDHSGSELPFGSSHDTADVRATHLSSVEANQTLQTTTITQPAYSQRREQKEERDGFTEHPVLDRGVNRGDVRSGDRLRNSARTDTGNVAQHQERTTATQLLGASAPDRTAHARTGPEDQKPVEQEKGDDGNVHDGAHHHHRGESAQYDTQHGNTHRVSGLTHDTTAELLRTDAPQPSGPATAGGKSRRAKSEPKVETTPVVVGGKNRAKGDASNAPATGVGGKTNKKERVLTPEEQLTQEPQPVQDIVFEWVNIFINKPVTHQMIVKARELARWKPEPGEIVACYKWMRATDTKGWYKAHGLDLGHVSNEFERFRSLKDQAQPVPGETGFSSGVSGRYTKLPPVPSLVTLGGVR